MKTAIELIAEERARQISAEGWTPEHDDKHTSAELTRAAISYAYTLAYPDEWAAERGKLPGPADDWPWAKTWWKPSPDNRVRELVKAGALIAAEIDRLQRVVNTKISHAPLTHEKQN